MAGIGSVPKTNAVRGTSAPRMLPPVLGLPGSGLAPVSGISYVVNGNPRTIAQPDAENLFKAADDLTNLVYWQQPTGITGITDDGDGYFTVTKAASANNRFEQAVTNWFPTWGATFSLYFAAKAGTLNALRATVDIDSAASITDVEVVSGPASAGIVSGRISISGLASSPSVFRATGTSKGWSTSVVTRVYPDMSGTTAGTIKIGFMQLILGDQPKPRPVNQETDYPMMAYRPHWRPTGDGLGRYSVVDTDGLVTLGECADIKTSPATTTTFNHGDSTRASMELTYEAGKVFQLDLHYTNSSNLMYVESTSTGIVRLRKYAGGVPTWLLSGGPILTGAKKYRFDLRINNGVAEFFLDDALVPLLVDDVSDVPLTGTGRITHDLTTAPRYITTEAYPRTPADIIIAGGKAAPAYGDPGVWLTKPNGDAFAVGASDAVMYTATTLVSGRVAEFGLDSNTTGAPREPRFDHGTEALKVDTASGNETPQPWPVGTTLSFLQLLRSDTIGSQFLIHDSAKKWKRFNVNTDAIPAANAYPAISNYNAALSIRNFAMIDLSKAHTPEFCDVLSSIANPINGGATPAFDERDGGYSATWDIVRGSTGETNSVFFKEKDTTNNYYVGGNTDNLILYSYVAGATLITASNAVPTPGTYKITLTVDADGATSLYVDNVLVGTTNLGDAKTCGLITFSFTGAADLNNFFLHPYPALGGSLGATDRVVGPRRYDAFSQEDDAMMIWREFVVAAGGDTTVQYRRLDSSNYLWNKFRSPGDFIGYETTTAAGTNTLINAGGVISDLDDAVFTMVGNTMEEFVNGSSVGISAGIVTMLTGDNGYVNQWRAGTSADALESWPYFADLFAPP